MQFLPAIGAAYGAYQVVQGARRMHQGFQNHNQQQVAGGMMQLYGGAMGPVFRGAQMGARVVHAGAVFGARMAIPQEREQLRNRANAGIQGVLDIFT